MTQKTTEKNSIRVRVGRIDDVVALSKLLPEFDNPYEAEDYHERLSGKVHLILIAYDKDQPIGFKVGYERGDFFYSWMGGVIPEYRRQGVASKLT